MPESSARYTLDKVTSEVRAEVSAELESAKKEAIQLTKTMLEETRNEVARVTEGSERQAESLKRQLIGSAELEARNKLLRTLEDATNQVFADALKRVSAKDDAQYEKALERLISEGLRVIGKGATVSCSPRDKKAVASIIGDINGKERAELKLDEKSIETAGGVVLSSKDKTIRFDNTFGARLERVKPQLRREVARALESGSG